MKRVSAVIGANFGDEGKGLFTDYLAHQEVHRTIVVRVNGGAQAGHTVVAPDGRRHVFHHFGSGTLAACPSFLSQYFLVNPVIFAEEYCRLSKLMRPLRPVVYVDLRAPVTTPWDMLVNQARELSRHEGRHGSCGLGIHETVERHKILPFTVGDLLGVETLWKGKLKQIRHDYYLTRLAEFGLDDTITPTTHEGICEGFIYDINVFKSSISGTPEWSHEFLDGSFQVLFEGAQGLRLDADSPYFPHVTCSRTGLTNVVALMREAELQNEPLNAFYITRPYLTRHGAGPLAHETKTPPYAIVDETNVPNRWQGALRYAWFDVEEFAKFVKADYGKARAAGIHIDPQLVLTCVDQLATEFVEYASPDSTTAIVSRHWKTLVGEILMQASLKDAYIAKGPTRNDVRRWP